MNDDPKSPPAQPQKGKEAPDPMQSDVGRPEPINETAGKDAAAPNAPAPGAT
jgi:hypothetical protein